MTHANIYSVRVPWAKRSSVHKSCRNFIGFLALFMFLAAGIYADIAPEPLQKGFNPVKKKGKQVRMVSEEVQVILTGRERCDFICDFVFLNQSKKKVKLEVGFPTSYANEVTDLVVEIAGRQAEIYRDHSSKKYRMHGYSKTSETHWLLWKMEFPPQLETQVHLTYWVKPHKNREASFVQITTYNDFAEYIYKNRPRFGAVAADYFAGIRTCSSGYILSTGSDWAGPIGKALVRVYSPTLGAAALRVISPWKNHELARRDNRSELVWTFIDFEPEFDLDVEFVPDIPVAKDLEILAGLIAKNPADEKLHEFQRLLSAFSEKTGPK
jgi:hypothetical protein